MFTTFHSCLILLRDIDQGTESIQKSSKLHHSLRKNNQKTNLCFICKALRDPKQLRASKGNENGSKRKATWSVNSWTRSRTTQDGLCLRLQGREDNRQYLGQMYIWLPHLCTHIHDKVTHVAIRKISEARANWPWGFPPFCQKVSWPFRAFILSCSHVPVFPVVPVQCSPSSPIFAARMFLHSSTRHLVPTISSFCPKLFIVLLSPVWRWDNGCIVLSLQWNHCHMNSKLGKS